MQQSKEAFEKRGVLIAVVSFAPPEKLVVYQRQRNWPFPILSDPERSAYMRFDLGPMSWLQLFGPATLKLYARIMLKGRRLQYYGKDDYRQGGGDFILDRRGNLLFAHRSRNPADRPSAQTLLEAIDGEEGVGGRV